MIRKEQRQFEILSSLAKLDYLTRSQIQTLHKLGSNRNASRVMSELSDYVSYFRDNQHVYYLNKEGRELVGCTKVRKRTIQARHYIMRNSLYIAFGCPASWESEMRLEIPKQVKVVCDALFKVGDRYNIVEIDHTQKMSVNKVKMNKYRKLIDLGAFSKSPKFVWMTTTEYRRKQIEKICEGLVFQVFTAQDFL